MQQKDSSACQHPISPALRLDPRSRQESGLCSHQWEPVMKWTELLQRLLSDDLGVDKSGYLDVESQFISFFSADEISAVI